MSNMYKTFQTNKDMEKSGIWLDYGSFRVKIARAGGGNDRFGKAIEHKTKPYRRAIQSGMMETTKTLALVREAFVETCVLAWEVNISEDEAKPEWAPGIHTPEGDIVEPTRDVILAALTALPDLYDDIQEQSTKAALFRAEVREEDAKNS